MPKFRFPDKSKKYRNDSGNGEKYKSSSTAVDSDSDSDSDDYSPKKEDKRPKERPARRPKVRISHVKDAPSPSFVMKLFDRSVDLTQFQPDTPLYPICRAWFRNNPKATNHSAEQYQKRKDDRKASEKDFYRLPSPHTMDEDFIPSPPPPPIVTEDFNIDYDPFGELPDKYDLLTKHLENWHAVKKRIRKGAQKREKRYEKSLTLIREMFLRA